MHPTGRYEWERIVRRLRVHAKDSRAVRPRVKFLAHVLATYADPDGSRVRPGIPTLTAVTGASESTVKRSLSELRDLGLLTVTRRGGGRRGAKKTTEYQLTCPVDLYERVDLIGPDEKRHNDEPRNITAAPAPVDNSESEANQVTSQSDDDDAIERSHSARLERLGGQNDRLGGHTGDLLPTHLDHSTSTNTSGSYPTQPTDRARDPTADPLVAA